MSVMTKTMARDVIAQLVDTEWQASEFASVPYFAENLAEPRLDELTTFMYYEIDFLDTRQATLGADPAGRTHGVIKFYAGNQVGKGTRSLYKMLDFLESKFRAKDVQSVRFLLPKPDTKNKGNGWHFEVLNAPFYFDSTPIAMG